jgi:DnaJ-class molecular chaperone with C-terminal Zn finger domain
MWEQNDLFAQAADEIGENPAKPLKPAKKKNAPKRRKKAKREVQDYYMLLDVSEEATAVEVKKGYIAKVRQYPPESHPEKFEKIRMAYETLYDKKLRKEYDIIRVYGESIEDLLAEAMRPWLTLRTVTNLLNRAILIDPESPELRVFLAHAYLRHGKLLEFEDQFYILKDILSDEEWIHMWTRKILILLDCVSMEDVMHELFKFSQAHPNAIYKYWKLYLEIYSQAGCPADLCTVLEQKAQGSDTSAASLEGYIAWIQVSDVLANKKSLAKAQAAIKYFIKAFKKTGDLSVLVKALLGKSQRCLDEKYFSSAQIFADLAYMADPQNKEAQSLAQHVKNVRGIIREMEKMMQDEKMFPVIIVKSFHWIHEEFQVMEEEAVDMEAFLPTDLIDEMEGNTEDYAASLFYLRKKYPQIYQHWKQAWDALLIEKTKGMNRDMRRRVR